MSLRSEQMTVAAPMSYVGSYRRLRRWIQHPAAWYTLGIALLAVWWTLDTAWYLIFGIFLVPYRLLRRGSRKRKIQAMQHRETLDAISRPTA